MLEIIIGLALVPFAIWGALLLIHIGWVIAPYLLFVITGGLGIIFLMDKSLGDYSVIPLVLCTCCILWIAYRRDKAAGLR